MTHFHVAEARDQEKLIAARELLAHEPINNAQLDEFLARRIDGIANHPRVLLAWANDHLVALTTMGPLIQVTDGPHRAISALGREIANRSMTATLLSGTPETVDHFIHGYHEKRAIPAIELELHRDILVLRRSPKPIAESGLSIRYAKLEDQEFVIEGLRSLILAEFGYDPGQRAHFKERVAVQIENNRWWIGEDQERRFICQRGLVSPSTIRLENIWVHPKFRGKGYATRALHTLTTESLKHHPTISLSVTTTNLTAHHIYMRLGFEVHGQNRLLFFKREGAAESIA